MIANYVGAGCCYSILYVGTYESCMCVLFPYRLWVFDYNLSITRKYLLKTLTWGNALKTLLFHSTAKSDVFQGIVFFSERMHFATAAAFIVKQSLKKKFEEKLIDKLKNPCRRRLFLFY